METSRARLIPSHCAVTLRAVDTRAKRNAEHRAGHDLLMYFTEANLMMRVDTHMYSLVDDSVLLVPKDTPYAFAYGSRCQYYCLSFSLEGESANALVQAMLKKRAPLMHVQDKRQKQALRGQMEGLYRHLLAPGPLCGPLGALYTEACFAKLLLEVYALQAEMDGAPPMDGPSQLVEQIKAYLEDNILAPLSLEKLESVFFLSRFHLCRLFRRETGMTIFTYVRWKKVELATKMLLDTDRNVTDICYACGFGSLQSFYNIFKRQTKTTPLAMRRQGGRERA